MKKLNLTFKNLIENKKLTFLVGAGCSVNPPSNLPAGNKMVEALINYSCAESEIERILEIKELRLEQLVEIIRDELDPQLNIIDYFGLCDTPNLQHFFLAEMLKKGHFVMTTNFDFLIEYGLEQSGVPKDKIVPVITKNDIIYNNTGYGITISDVNDYRNKNNLFYNNSFNNAWGINAIDNGTNTQWNLGDIGNFWHDYTGYDLNDDGIGDISYNITGINNGKDEFSLWDNGDDLAPNINIISPISNQVFSSGAPDYTVEITDPNLDTMRYSLNGGQNITFNSSGTIRKGEWDALPDGTVIITFYANDTAGNIGSESVNIIKNTSAPSINLLLFFTQEDKGGDQIPSYPFMIFIPLVIITMISLILIYQKMIKIY